MSKHPSELRPEWEALNQEAAALVAEGETLRGLSADHPKVKDHEARFSMLAAQKDFLSSAAWVGTVVDLADVLLLAEIAWDLHWGVGTFPQLPADIDDRCQREVAVAYLVRGVFTASQAQAGTVQGGTP
jgi:hypothetical protein